METGIDARVDGFSLKKVGTTVALGGLAAGSLLAEVSGIDQDLPTAARLAVDSGAHPLLGYVGAWAATSVLKRPVEGARAAAAFVGASLADLATETAQSILIASPQYAEFMASSNLPETTKDYVFALAGLGLYMAQNRRSDQ